MCTGSGQIKGLWNYKEELLVVERRNGDLLILDFPSKNRAVEFLCANFVKLQIPLKNIKHIRPATKKDIERESKKPRKIIKKQTRRNVVEEYMSERGNLTFEDLYANKKHRV